MAIPKGSRSFRVRACLKPDWILAKTCTGCGKLGQNKDFRRTRSGKGQPQLAGMCRQCESATSYERSRRSGFKSSRDHRQREQARSLPRAYKSASNQEWTGPELELLTREDLTAKQIAGMIGRTINAVLQARTKLRRGKWEKANVALGKIRG